ncbi:rhodanese-like domain-containing protein [Myxococcus llanfairpwllgwyngyllgogerychwyrndrobwllllantysiliogogogochensis]|uniref:Rhodanese-like domain-containing protein n=1 Tax=Myxococcus llanfairpwllgwyngyllgogerychwyrndrobwllllantysiliogogogochensis TaxID=2590453 RepID=A0A540X1H6_9BACT|nr:rhodanese-like domain-containing protein [Myxococcus llanfairpwllgwyngyllgogerychwyrndrobwllllantysiliogogogochensis]TQF15109.1 rhodanese-like domain-containing protein [Myxococcus llanfairpwllgwyngyllgogerychwyrndrobwllllantysiliogogogochensis]
MKPTLVIATVLASLLLGACASQQRPVRDEAHRWVDAGATLVDVRTPEEFAAGHLPGAVNIPVDDLSQRLQELGPPENPLVIYCRSGGRSARAEKLLKEQGFQQVLNLGPMSTWE